jgi:hypothetical protein
MPNNQRGCMMDYTEYTDKVSNKVKKLFDAETPNVKSKIKFGFNSYEERLNIAFLAGKYAGVLISENETPEIVADVSRKLGIFLSSLEPSCVAPAIKGLRGWLETQESKFNTYIGDRPDYVNGPRFSLNQEFREDVARAMDRAEGFYFNYGNAVVKYLWSEPRPANINIPANDNAKGTLRVDIAEFRNESLNSDSKNKNTPN